MKQVPVALEAAHLMDRLQRLVRAGEASARLNPAQWEAIRYLNRANRFSRTPAALADYLGSTRGTVSQTLIALEAKGFVERRESLRDRRSVRLELTAAGREALEQDPVKFLAQDIGEVAGASLDKFRDNLRGVLLAALARNQGRTFGFCNNCRHFQPVPQPPSGLPHYCTLLKEPLAASDAQEICVEQEPV